MQPTIDKTTFSTLFDQYYSRIFKYMYFRVNDTADAEELAAQVFERVLTSWQSYKPERSPVAAWLFGIARHVVLDYQRSNHRHATVPLEGQDQLVDPDLSPEQSMMESVRKDCLSSALAQLDERAREVIALKFSSGLNNRQIASQIGLKESHIGVIIFRAVQRLRELMPDEEVIYEG